MQLKHILTTALGAGIIGLGLGLGQAQIANYAGPVTGGEWNTAANWDVLVPPGVGTNAVIGVGTNVNYNIPMTAANFGLLTNNGTLNINAAGFNAGAIIMASPASQKLFINNGAVVTAGGVILGTNANVTLAAGGSLTVNGTLSLATGESSKAPADFSTFTNNGGTLMANATTINPGTGIGNGLLVINGGINNLGNTIVGRSAAGAGGQALGLDGLVVYGGQVVTTNLNIGNSGSAPSSLAAFIDGGVVTNFGNMTISQLTSPRFSRFVQNAGLFVMPDPGLVNPNGTVAGTISMYAVLGGTNIVGGFFLGNSNGSPSTINFTNGGTMYVGSQGIASNGAVLVTAVLNGGGLLGATAPWTSTVGMKLNGGTFTIQAADPSGTPNDITLSNALTGSGGLIKTGGGILTLGAPNTYSGNTVINGGSLVLLAGSSLTSSKVNVGSGTTFDVSQVSGFTLSSGQTLSGSGTVAGSVTAASGATVDPGSNSVTGTLTISGSLTENGGVNNQFNLSSSPTGPGNDFLNVSGGLVLSGNNTVIINGSLSTAGPYPLIGYNGSLTGDTSGLTASGATGIFSNSVANSIIYFIAQASVRAATNITWIGNPTANNWDTETTTNWLNTGTAALDFFVPGDTALFSNLGATNPLVNIPGSVFPGGIIVNTTSNYTLLGNGAIGGGGGITVSNGTLNVLTTNNFTGAVIVDGGTLATTVMANSGSASGIGASSADPGNVVINGGTLAYDGSSASTDHGMTLTSAGGAFDVTNGTTLTLNGILTGSGGLTLVDSGTLTLANANSYAGNTTISNGTLNLNNVNGANASTITLAGGTLGFTASGQPTFINNVTVVANSGLTSAGGNNNILTGILLGSSNVTLNVNIGGTGTFTMDGSMTNFLGVIELGTSSGSFRFNSTGGAGGDTAFGGLNTTYDLGTSNASLLARNSNTINLGALEGGTNTTLRGQGSGAGTVVWRIGSSTNNPSTTFYGIITNGVTTTSLCSINKVGTGTLSLAGQNVTTGTITVSSGTLALTNNPFTGFDGSFDSSPTINIQSGAILSVTGRSDHTLQLGAIANQVLEGNGTLVGTVNVNGSGIISPGGGPTGSIGTLTAGGVTAGSGIVWMKLNRGSSPNADKLIATSLTAGGTLLVTNVGAPFQVGDTFFLFGGNIAPAASFNLQLPNYYTWDTSRLGIDGSIKVTAAFTPAISHTDFSQLAAGGEIDINATNGQPDALVNILTSTNLLLPLSSWQVNSSAEFDNNGNISGFPVFIDQTQPQTYIILQGE